MQLDLVRGDDGYRGVPLTTLYRRHSTAHQVDPVPRILHAMADNFARDAKSLDFSETVMTVGETYALMDTLTECPALETLSLRACTLKAETVPLIIKTIKNMLNLYSLDLSGNATIGFSAAKLLLQWVKSNKRIVELDLSDTSVLASTNDLLQQYVRDNATSGAYWVGGTPNKKVAVAGRSPTGSDKPTTTASPSPFTLATPMTPIAQIQTSLTYQQQQQQSLSRDSEESATKQQGSPLPSRGASPNQREKSEAGALADKAKQTLKDLQHDDELAETAANAVHNLKAKQHAINSEKRSVTVVNSFLDQAKHWGTEVKAKIDRNDEALREYDEGWRSPCVQGSYSVDRLIKDGNLGLYPADLQEYKRILNMEQSDPTLSNIDLTSLVEELLADTTDDVRCKYVKDVLDRVCKVSPLPFQEFTPHFMRCYHLYHADDISVSKMLSAIEETDATYTKLIMKRDEFIRTKEKDFANGNFLHSEVAHDKAISVQEDLLDLCLQRIKALKDPAARESLLITLNNISTQTEDKCTYIRRLSETIIKRVEDDMAAIDKYCASAMDTYDSQKKNFVLFREQTWDNLTQNRKHQEAVIDAIVKKVEEWTALTETRLQQMELFVAEREKQEQLIQDYNKSVEVAGEWSRKLKKMIGAAEKSAAFVEHFENFFKKAPPKITHKAESSWNKVSDGLVVEQKTYLEVFRHYYLDVGEMVYKKEKREEEIERSLRNLQYKIEFAAESLDPNVDEYKKQQEDLVRTRQEIKRKLAILRSNGDIAVEEFQPTEQALRERGVNFLHPRIELEELNVQRRSGALGKRKVYAQAEQRYLEDDNDELLRIDNTVKEAKSSGLATLISPLGKQPLGTPTQSTSQTPDKKRTLTPRTKYIFA
eukprot:TRINITY_DN85229_c0_g1_i1.p1 TRINITY_DN85229_c0_g1~~TRINITY_DN85229_c0_g1_i1.p1  ORF type:complete len:879 (-),score=94.04 TRINITY_DN85229_c0_g1_i1:209-2845(-)